MRGTLKYLDETGDNGPSGTDVLSLPREWLQEWFTTVCLMIILAALVFLMMLSIYLVVTKPEPSAIPEQRHARAAGSLCASDDCGAMDFGAGVSIYVVPGDGAA